MTRRAILIDGTPIPAAPEKPKRKRRPKPKRRSFASSLVDISQMLTDIYVDRRPKHGWTYARPSGIFYGSASWVRSTINEEKD